MIALLLLGGLTVALAISVFDGDDDGSEDRDPDSTVEGTDGDDTLSGGSGDDLLTGLLGDDELSGRDGDDTLRGDEGRDKLYGGEGNDLLEGGENVDFVFGGAGDDTLDGGEGNDKLFGRDDDDVVLGQEGDDILSGGAGDDTLGGGTGDDLLLGEDGSDSLRGGSGDDVLVGANVILRDADGDEIDPGEFGANVDLLSTDIEFTEDDAVDTLDGDAGDDLLVAGSGDTATGGAGFDVFAAVDGGDEVAAGDEITITDFDPMNDTLLILLPQGGNIATTDEDYLSEQRLAPDGLRVTLISGGTIFLAGVTEVINESNLVVVDLDDAASAAAA